MMRLYVHDVGVGLNGSRELGDGDVAAGGRSESGEDGSEGRDGDEGVHDGLVGEAE